MEKNLNKEGHNYHLPLGSFDFVNNNGTIYPSTGILMIPLYDEQGNRVTNDGAHYPSDMPHIRKFMGEVIPSVNIKRSVKWLSKTLGKDHRKLTLCPKPYLERLPVYDQVLPTDTDGDSLTPLNLRFRHGLHHLG